MVDLHTHILPGIDDGARDWATATEMCRMAVEDGIDHIVCSPHANDAFTYDREKSHLLLAELEQKAGLSGELSFSLGCDFNFSYQNIQEALTDPAKFLIGNTKYLLVELSDFAIPPTICDTLVRFIGQGITPIITHPERNRVLQQRPELVLWLAQQRCVIQLTANALTGTWGAGPQKLALWLLERQAAHVIASDAHNIHSRPPILSKARDIVIRQFSLELALAMVEANPSAVVRGQALPYFPEPIF